MECNAEPWFIFASVTCRDNLDGLQIVRMKMVEIFSRDGIKAAFQYSPALRQRPLIQ